MRNSIFCHSAKRFQRSIDPPPPQALPNSHQTKNVCFTVIRAKLAELEAQRQNEVGNMAGGLEFELDKKKVREQVRWGGVGCGGTWVGV